METLCPNTPLWLRNGHADTIFAKFIQRPAPAYRRELLPDSTGRTLVACDFVDAANPDAPLGVFGGATTSNKVFRVQNRPFKISVGGS